MAVLQRDAFIQHVMQLLTAAGITPTMPLPEPAPPFPQQRVGVDADQLFNARTRILSGELGRVQQRCDQYRTSTVRLVQIAAETAVRWTEAELAQRVAPPLPAELQPHISMQQWETMLEIAARAVGLRHPHVMDHVRAQVRQQMEAEAAARGSGQGAPAAATASLADAAAYAPFSLFNAPGAEGAGGGSA